MSEPSAELSPGLMRQREIYRAGLAGKTPEQPVSFEELEREACSVMNPSAYDYVAGGAGSEDTMRANLEAFRRYRLVPRFLRDVSRRDLGVDLLGTRLPSPILLAPIGVLGIVHKDAELAAARAAAAMGVPMILSTASSVRRWNGWPRRWATPRDGSSSTGPGATSWPPASCSGPSAPASARSW